MYLESSYSDNGADSISSNIAPQLVLGLYGSNYITVKELQNLLNDVLFQRTGTFCTCRLELRLPVRMISLKWLTSV